MGFLFSILSLAYVTATASRETRRHRTRVHMQMSSLKGEVDRLHTLLSDVVRGNRHGTTGPMVIHTGSRSSWAWVAYPAAGLGLLYVYCRWEMVFIRGRHGARHTPMCIGRESTAHVSQPEACNVLQHTRIQDIGKKIVLMSVS